MQPVEFEINFLERKRSTAWLEFFETYRTAVIAAIMGITLVLLVAVYFQVITRKTTEVVASGQKLIKVTMEKEKVSGLGGLLTRLEHDRIDWTEKLTSLSDAMPKHVYLTSLELQKKTAQAGLRGKGKEQERLVLQGVLISSDGEDPSSVIQQFLNNLKDSDTFMDGFDSPVLVSVSDARKERCRLCLDFEFYLARKVREL